MQNEFAVAIKCVRADCSKHFPRKEKSWMFFQSLNERNRRNETVINRHFVLKIKALFLDLTFTAYLRKYFISIINGTTNQWLILLYYALFERMEPRLYTLYLYASVPFPYTWGGIGLCAWRQKFIETVSWSFVIGIMAVCTHFCKSYRWEMTAAMATSWLDSLEFKGIANYAIISSNYRLQYRIYLLISQCLINIARLYEA